MYNGLWKIQSYGGGHLGSFICGQFLMLKFPPWHIWLIHNTGVILLHVLTIVSNRFMDICYRTRHYMHTYLSFQQVHGNF